jgi:hypothetical protein
MFRSQIIIIIVFHYFFISAKIVIGFQAAKFAHKNKTRIRLLLVPVVEHNYYCYYSQ